MGSEDYGEEKHHLLAMVDLSHWHVFRALLSASIQSNATKPIGPHFTLQINNNPKHTIKSTQELLNEMNESKEQTTAEGHGKTSQAFGIICGLQTVGSLDRIHLHPKLELC